MKVDPSTLSPDAAYYWQIASIVPRPIAWVSTLNDDGTANLAPFSFFTGVSSDPPTCLICASTHRVGSRGPSTEAADSPTLREKKDTWRNIERTGEFVVHVVTEALGPQMNFTARAHPYGVDELAAAGLTALASERVKPPRVAESPVAMECRLDRIVEVGRGPTAIIVGEILLWHVRDEVMVNGRIDMGRLDAIGRMSGSTYTRTRDRFDLVRSK